MRGHLAALFIGIVTPILDDGVNISTMMRFAFDGYTLTANYLFSTVIHGATIVSLL
jgi:hypothetical protein